jgi:archaellum component FlaF (FlaF/FlaG flagellin family)
MAAEVEGVLFLRYPLILYVVSNGSDFCEFSMFNILVEGSLVLAK